MAQLKCYFQTQLETDIVILPEQLDGDLEDHIFDNLREKVEKKCVEHGYVMRVNRIIEHGKGFINGDILTVPIVFKVKYDCYFCSPVKNLEMVCMINNLYPGFLMAENGPVKIIISYQNIDLEKFAVDNNHDLRYKSSNDKLESGQFIKVSIMTVQFVLYENRIAALARLVDTANKKEVEQYQKDLSYTSSGATEAKEFI
jgi:DNA-directed RNA polymerase subunit E'/Rpb7